MRKIKGDALFFRVLIRKRCFIFYILLLILSRKIVFKIYLQLLRLYFFFFNFEPVGWPLFCSWYSFIN